MGVVWVGNMAVGVVPCVGVVLWVGPLSRVCQGVWPFMDVWPFGQLGCSLICIYV